MTDVNGTGPGGAPQRKVSPVFKVILIAVFSLKMLIWDSAKSLSKKVYQPSGNFIVWIFGVLAGFGSGILTASALTKAYHWEYYTAIPVAMMVAAFCYYHAWPLFYHYGLRRLVLLSQKLWNMVPTSGKPFKTKDTSSIRYHVDCGVENNDLSVRLSWLTVAGFATYAGIYLWSNWADITTTQLVVGSVFALMLGKWLVNTVFWLEMPLAGSLISAGVIYSFKGWTTSLLLGNFVGSWIASFGGNAATGVEWFGYVTEFLLLNGIAFPLLHIGFTPIVEWFAERRRRVWADVYLGEERVFRDTYLQVVNIVVALAVTAGTYLALPVFGFSTVFDAGLYAIIPTLVGLLAYLIVGSALMARYGNVIIGAIVAVAAMCAVAFLWLSYGLWNGNIGAVAAGSLTAVFTVNRLYPLWYKGWRAIGTGIAGVLHAPLVNLHTRLKKEIVDSFSTAYAKHTDSHDLWLHSVNIVVALAVDFVAYYVADWLDFGLVGTSVALVAGSIGVAASYLLVGRLLLRAGNPLIGGVVATGFGAGVAYFSYTQLHYGIIGLAGFGILTAASLWFILYPVFFVLAAAVADLTKANSWLLPRLKALYDFCWRHCDFIRAFVTRAYEKVKAIVNDIYFGSEAVFSESYGLVLNLVAAPVVGYLAYRHIPTFGFSSVIEVMTVGLLTTAAALASFVFVGFFLQRAANFLTGLVVSAAAAWFVFGFHHSNELWFGDIGAGITAGIVFLSLMFVATPVVLLGLRKISLKLAAKIHEPLVRMHKQLSTRVLNSYNITYRTHDEHSALFLHLVNIGFAGALVYVGWALSAHFALGLVGTAAVMATSVPVAFFAYVIGGKAFQHASNVFVGFLVSAEIAFQAASHVAAGDTNNNLMVAGIAGLIAFIVVCPLAYVLLISIGDLIKAPSWLLPRLTKAHEFCWNHCEFIWRNLKRVVKAIGENMEEVYETSSYSPFGEAVSQVVNFVAVFEATKFVYKLLPVFGFSPLIDLTLTCLATGVAALVSYMVLGQLFRKMGMLGTGFYLAGHGAYCTYVLTSSLGFAAYVLSAVALISLLTVIVPGVFLGVRKVAKDGVEKLRDPLVKLHEQICHRVLNAFPLTYFKHDDNERLHLHIVNTAVAFFAAWMAHTYVPGAFSVPAAVVSLLVSYLGFGGILFSRLGRNFLVGGLASCAFGIYTGVHVMDHMAFGFGPSVWVGAGAAAVMFGILFTIWYSFWASIFDLTKATSWLLPVIEWPFTKVWARLARVWKVIKELYAEFSVWVGECWVAFKATVAQTYADFKAWVEPKMEEYRQVWNDTWAAAAEYLKKFRSKD